MANFHWVGATGNSTSKYDWNVAANWLIKDVGPTSGYDSSWLASAFRRSSRPPTAGDTVYVGAELHCLSPILFGGFSGSAFTNNGGNWGTGLTTGVTGGGINMIYTTDVPAAEDPISFSYSLLAGLTQDPGLLFSDSNVALDTDYADLLINVNPHSGAIGASAAAKNSLGATGGNALYPFPYLGGGLTSTIMRWALDAHKSAYAAFNGLSGGTASGATGYISRNSWVGGGFTGSVPDRAGNSALRVRINNSGLKITSGVSSTLAKQKAFDNKIVEMFVCGDKMGNGIIGSGIVIDQPYKLGHTYTFRGSDTKALPVTYGERKSDGLLNTINAKGDFVLGLYGVTAAQCNLDMHASTYISAESSMGGVVVVDKPFGVSTEPARKQYNYWPLLIEGSITGGVIGLIYGATASVSVPYANQLYLGSFDSVLEATDGISGAYETTWAPQVAIGGGSAWGTTGAGKVTSIGTIVCQSPASQKPYGVTNPRVWNMQLYGSSRIGQISLQNSLLVPSNSASPNIECYIGNIDASQNSIIDFTVNSRVDNIYIGSMTGSNQSNYRMLGGINAIDETVKVYCSAGMKFMNTKLLGQSLVGGGFGAGGNSIGTDARAQKFSTTNQVIWSGSSNDKNDLSVFANPTKGQSEAL